MPHKTQFSLATVLRPKDVVGVLVVEELEVEVLDDFAGCLHSFLVAVNFDILLGLKVDELLDFIEILHSAGSLSKQLL
jgi:hypothetical protein